VIITISGMPGSGKTTIGKLLAEKLGYKFYSMGDLRGRMAMEKGLTIDELNELGMKEEWTDRDVDEFQKQLGEKEDNFVIEGRLSFYFIPHSIKIFLDVDLETAAKRIFKDQRPDEKKVNSIKEVLEIIKKRIENDKKRYQKYYGIKNFMDKRHYDLVINTTKLSKEEVIEKVLNFLKKKGIKIPS